MRALVTGASGFVGRHLTAHLEACGDEVVGLDRDHGPNGGADILDGEALRAELDAGRPDVVYHLAGWSDVGGSWTDPVGALRTNAEGTLNVLSACRQVPVGRVFVVTSADVYGVVDEAELPITEEHPLRPVSPYAASKVAADFLALQAVLGHDMDVVRARSFNHLGPGQSDRFVAPAIALRIAENERGDEEEVPVGNLTARRDFTDVRDVVRAYRLLVERGASGEVYNVCSGRAVAIQVLADQLLALARRPMRVVVDPARHRPVDTPVLCGSYERLRRATGWEPAVPLATTLGDLLEDCRARVRTT
ncbi:MAG: GDP-mannose 4,6-dehydratase [Acidimicrobiales bacterium]